MVENLGTCAMAGSAASTIARILWLVINLCTPPVIPEIISPTQLFSVALHSQTVTWNEATRICAKDGARLAILDTPYKNAMAMRLVLPFFHANSSKRAAGGRDYGAIWLGFYFKLLDGEYTRQAACSSQPVSSWTHWTPNSRETDGIEDPRQCVRLTIIKEHWKTYNCTKEREFLCEYLEAGKCSFDNTTLLAINTNSPSIITTVTQYGVSEDEACHNECLRRISGDKECWAISETLMGKDGRECMLYFAIDHETMENEMVLITPEERASHPVLQIKNCFKSTFDNTTSDMSMHKLERRPMPYCNVTVNDIATGTPKILTNRPMSLVEPTNETVEDTTLISTLPMCSPCPPCERSLYRPQAEQIKIDKEIEAMIEKLKVNRSLISATRRRYTSANDNRPVAKYVGGIAVVLLVLIGAGIVSLDITCLIRDFGQMLININPLFRK